jgi:predicted GNAT family acetyltransferase
LSADEGGRQKVASDIRDNPTMSRFEMSLGDGALAVAYYKVEDGRVVLLHTEVPQEPSGLGYGSRLAHGVFEALRRDRKRVIAKCPFMSSYAARHPEYGALLDG